MFGVELLLDSFWTTCLIGITTALLIYWYSIKNHDYWKKRGIPFVKPWPFVGTVLELFTTSMHTIEENRYFELGPLYGHFEGSKPLLSIGDPVLLREILVKDFVVFSSRRLNKTGDTIIDSMLSILEGEDWKRVRTIVTPTFTTGKIKRMLSIFKDCSMTLIENFKKACEERKTVDAKRLYGAFTMDIIASSAFSTKIDSHNDPDNQFVQSVRKIFNQNINWRFVFFLVAPKLMKFFQFKIFSPEVMDFFKGVTLQIVEERKRTGQVRNDFLQLLMDTAKEVGDEQKSEVHEKEDIASNYGELGLSMDELVAQCVIFFLAGYDTTASTLSFATYLLALHPDIQDRLQAEIDDAIQGTEGELTYEAIQSMKNLDNVISETLRLYPPAVRLERVADSDYKLGDTGIIIPKGMIVTIPTYAMHRDPKLYPDPETFDPDRFTPEERAKRDPYAYLPFGAGPRNCVAMRFALMEVKVCLAHVLRSCNIKRCPETQVPLEFYRGQGLLQPKGIIVELEMR